MLIVCSCGIFEPRDTFEIPEPGIFTDRFKFSDVFTIAGKKFTWKNYETLFWDTLHFYYNNSEEYNKNSVIGHLRAIERQYPRLRVKWTRDEDYYSEPDGPSKLKVFGLIYSAMYDSTKTDSVYTGVANMVIINDGEYKICVWEDFPDGDQKSFFAPTE